MSIEAFETVPAPNGSAAAGRDATRFGQNAEPFILLILLEGASYGYEIRTRLEEFGFRRANRDPSVVYRLLRKLEDAKLIESHWDVGTGPARHYYSLTDIGRAHLGHSAEHLRRQATRLKKFFTTYRRHTTVPPSGAE